MYESHFHSVIGITKLPQKRALGALCNILQSSEPNLDRLLSKALQASSFGAGCVIPSSIKSMDLRFVLKHQKIEKTNASVESRIQIPYLH